MPKISIIIPIYGVEKYISECIESIKKQSFTNYEVIAVNDETKDRSAEIYTEMTAGDPRFKLLEEKNSGAGVARNLGLSVATGEYVCFMDPDDFYPDEHVLRDLYTEISNYDADACTGSLRVHYEKGAPRYRRLKDYIYKKHGWTEYRDSLRYYNFQTFIFSMRLLKKHDIKFPKYRVFEDPPFLVHALTAARRFRTLHHRFVYTYRIQNKQSDFTPQKIHEMACGAGDILFYTKDFPGYAPLHEKIVNEFFGDFSEGVKDAAGNLFVQQILNHDVSLTRLLRDLSLKENNGQLLPPLQKVSGKKRTGELPRDFTGLDWLAVIWRYQIKRKIAGFRQCLKENGFWYTLKHILIR